MSSIFSGHLFPFVTAGFWNNHVHILTPTLLHARGARGEELNQPLDTMFNRWGFTTVFDISSVLDNTLALRRRIESGELRGPQPANRPSNSGFHV